MSSLCWAKGCLSCAIKKLVVLEGIYNRFEGLFFKIYFYLMCECFACIYVCVPYACLVPVESKRDWTWSYGFEQSFECWESNPAPPEPSLLEATPTFSFPILLARQTRFTFPNLHSHLLPSPWKHFPNSLLTGKTYKTCLIEVPKL